MPIHINEMIIRANIVEPGDKPTEAKTAATAELDRDEIIRECVAIVMEMVNSKKQR